MVEDPDEGEVGDFFKNLAGAGAAGETLTVDETLSWVREVRTSRGVATPLIPTSAAEARAELSEPPLAPDEVRFAVAEDEGIIEYLIRSDTVALHRDAEVSYHDMTLTADRIRFYSARDLIIAEGNCVLTDPSQLLLGVRMSYDVETEKGLVLGANAESAQGFYGGRRVKKIGPKTVAAYRGAFTTCDLGHPHYRFWSPQLKVYLEDKVVARPAVLLVGDIPVAAAPYYFFSLRKDRHSGFLTPYIRYFRKGEFVVNNGYYWVWNDYSDITFLLDYDSRKGWQKSANVVYLYGSRSTVNNFYASQMRERDTAVEWWKIYASHRQDFTDTCAALLRLDLRNSVAYDAYLEPEFEIRTEEQLESFVNVSQSWTNYQLSVDARQTRNKTTETGTTTSGFNSLAAPPYAAEPYHGILQTTSDPLPRAVFYANRREIGHSAFYYQWGANAAHYYDFENEASLLKQATMDVTASRPFSVLRYLRVNPNVTGDGNWYDRDKYGMNQRWLGTWDTALSLSTKIYGLFEKGETTFRHTVNPAVTHHYRPPIDQSWMVSGGAVQEEMNKLSFELRQNFDLKLPEKKTGAAAETSTVGAPRERAWEEVYEHSRTGLKPPRGTSIAELRKATTAGKVVNLAAWTTTTSYDLGPMATDERRITDLVNTLELTPNFQDWYFVTQRLEARNDWYSLALKDFDVSTSVSFTSARGPSAGREGEAGAAGVDPYGAKREADDTKLDPNVYAIDTITGRKYEAGEGMGQGWNLSVSHDYSWSDTGFNTHSLKGAASFDLTKKWRLGYDAYYDINQGQLISEHYRIYRNLHRWEAEVRVSFEDANFIYWFELRLIDLPEVQLYGTQERELPR